MNNVKSIRNTGEDTAADPGITFEEALTRLEKIVSSLEERELSLDESLALYEEGVKLAAICNKILDNAAVKIKMLDEGVDEEDFKIAEVSREGAG